MTTRQPIRSSVRVKRFLLFIKDEVEEGQGRLRPLLHIFVSSCTPSKPLFLNVFYRFGFSSSSSSSLTSHSSSSSSFFILFSVCSPYHSSLCFSSSSSSSFWSGFSLSLPLLPYLIYYLFCLSSFIFFSFLSLSKSSASFYPLLLCLYLVLFIVRMFSLHFPFLSSLPLLEIHIPLCFYPYFHWFSNCVIFFLPFSSTSFAFPSVIRMHTYLIFKFSYFF